MAQSPDRSFGKKPRLEISEWIQVLMAMHLKRRCWAQIREGQGMDLLGPALRPEQRLGSLWRQMKKKMEAAMW